jgi:ABC-type lipoprotein release transport system permease subunit
MKIICKRKFKNLRVGDSVDFITRSNKIQESEIIGKFPIGAYYDKSYTFIYYDDFKEHFCTLKEFRKIKFDRLNEI